eukprot:jgi/Orpsp1_1/1187785/evm.model.d7180000060165.1
MEKIRSCLLCIFIFFSLLFYNTVYSKEFYIKNDNDFKDLTHIINDNQNDNELIIHLIDNYYDMSVLPYTIDMSIITNISFIGNKNGTIFDYKRDKKGRMIFNIINNKGETIKFENIIFENFNPDGVYEIEILLINAISDNYFFIVNNCTFQNNDYRILRTQFFCYFSIMDKSNDSNKDIVFLYSSNSHEDLNIRNSIFEDINVNSIFPLINSENINLLIENTVFSNCYTASGYLFNIRNTINLYHDQSINVKNSTFTDICTIFHGDTAKYTISDSIFTNITLRNGFPAISDSKYSIFNINNSQFSNM